MREEKTLYSKLTFEMDKIIRHQLFHDIQMNKKVKKKYKIDSKMFADATLKKPADKIIKAYEILLKSGADKKVKGDETRQLDRELFDFIDANFEFLKIPEYSLEPEDLNSIASYCDALLKKFLVRQPVKIPEDGIIFGSSIPLQKADIFPGGRFQEKYCWDSYWILKAVLMRGNFDDAGNTPRPKSFAEDSENKDNSTLLELLEIVKKADPDNPYNIEMQDGKVIRNLKQEKAVINNFLKLKKILDPKISRHFSLKEKPCYIPKFFNNNLHFIRLTKYNIKDVEQKQLNSL